MKKIILATHNKDKVEEIRSILNGLPLKIESFLEHPDIPHVLEDGITLEENALKKAKEIFDHTGIPALSDDTGLEVFGLEMRPGVYSARYAGENVTYEDNNRKLLAEMAGLPLSRRAARFRCVAAIVGPDIEKLTTGICHGKIILEPRGDGGFGYDPLFKPDGYDLTFAELSASVKNEISHRAKAFRQMKSILSAFISGLS